MCSKLLQRRLAISLKSKNLEQDEFGSRHEFELKFLFSIFSKLNLIKINKVDVQLEGYVTLQLLCNPWIQSKIFRKVSENSVFPYPVHSTVNLPAWRSKDKNFTFVSFLCLFTETINPKRKVFLSKLHDKCWQICRNPWRIVNIPFCDVTTKIGTFLFVNSC